MHYPRKLIQHLTKERYLIVEKSSLGIYTISKEIFSAQIIVTQELPAEENLYLHQLTNAYSSKKGAHTMVCEGLLNLFGTSSEEIIEKTRKEANDYYQPQIDSLSSQNQYLMDLLKKNNIPFETAPNR